MKMILHDLWFYRPKKCRVRRHVYPTTEVSWNYDALTLPFQIVGTRAGRRKVLVINTVLQPLHELCDIDKILRYTHVRREYVVLSWPFLDVEWSYLVARPVVSENVCFTTVARALQPQKNARQFCAWRTPLIFFGRRVVVSGCTPDCE